MSKTIDLLLINPYLEQGGNAGWSISGEHILDPSEIMEHLGIGYLAAILENNGIKIKIIDADLEMLSNNDIINIICQFDVLAIGISVVSEAYLQAKDLIHKIRTQYDKDVHIIIGGSLIRLAREKSKAIFDDCDCIIVGEAESVILNIIQDIKNKKELQKIIFPSLLKIDDIPFPKRYNVPLLYNKLQTINKPKALQLLSSRGCVGTCRFCNIADFKFKEETKWRYRSAFNVTEEIKYLNKKYKPEWFCFIDDSFLCGNKGQERAIESIPPVNWWFDVS